MRLLKFGGTSMGDAASWQRVLRIISEYDRSAVVVSATARTTRRLVETAGVAANNPKKATAIAEGIQSRHRQLVINFIERFCEDDENSSEILALCNGWIDHCTDRLLEYLEHISQTGTLSADYRDAIAAIGEQLSSRLLVYCATAYGLPAEWIDAREVIKTDSEFGSARPQVNLIQKTAQIAGTSINEGTVPIMGGYYGEDRHGNITTLGFEGSDLSASLLGAALDAESIEIWTDVNGVYTCDPRVVNAARSISELSYREAAELAYFGAKVLHPDTMKPAEEKGIPVLVKNIFEPEHPGTRIYRAATTHQSAKAIALLREATCLTISANSSNSEPALGHADEIFATLRAHNIPDAAFLPGESTKTVILKQDFATGAVIQSMKKSGVAISQKTGVGVISLIGCTFASDLAKQVKKSLAEDHKKTEQASLYWNKAGDRLHILLPQHDLEKAVQNIHRAVFETAPASSGIPSS